MPSLVPYTCFQCRSTYKRPFQKGLFYRKCPSCSSQSVMMDVRFKPPRKRDDKQWKKVEHLAQNGFYFQKVYLKNGSVWQRQSYPKDLKQAKEFVVKFKDQAFNLNLIN
jgi:DNA-directed RNA polymerase subunit RPC12/RpoP